MNSANKAVYIIITLALLFGLGIILAGGDGEKEGRTQNVEIKDGVQYVTIDAKGGYFPATSNAKAGIPTKLIVKTDGTYDCSASLVVREADFQQILPQTGETEIDLGIKNPGETVVGICSMGMYNFKVDFQS